MAGVLKRFLRPQAHRDRARRRPRTSTKVRKGGLGYAHIQTTEQYLQGGPQLLKHRARPDYPQTVQTGPVKRSTAVRHVTELAEEANRLAHLPSDLARPLSELWVGGDLLDGAEQVEWALVVVRLDIPVDEFPHLALHPAMAACESFLRLDKRPIDARWRPRHVPAWDHDVRRVARVWSAQTDPTSCSCATSATTRSATL